MLARDFCFWLQGFFEINAATNPIDEALEEDQVELIKRHLALVFKHDIDPSMGSAGHQEELNEVHGGGKPPFFTHVRPNGDVMLRC